MTQATTFFLQFCIFFFSIPPEPPDCVLTAFYRQLQQLTEPTTQRLPGVSRDHPPSIHYTLLPQVFSGPKKKRKACIKDKIIKYCILNCFIRKKQNREIITSLSHFVKQQWVEPSAATLWRDAAVSLCRLFFNSVGLFFPRLVDFSSFQFFFP